MKFFVLIPTYNEAENINRTLGEVLRVFEEIGTKHDMHVLVTDANSKDGTGQLVRDFQSTHPNVHLIVEEAKRGLGAAYTDAMREAFETHQAEAIITFDADLSHDVNLIPKIVEKIASGANFVAGSRYKKGGSVPEEWGVHRKILSYMGNLFVRIIYFEKNATDYTSGFKSITKEVYQKIKVNLGKKFQGYTFIIAFGLEALKSGYKVVEIPYHFKDRTLGKSKMSSEYFYNAFKFVVESRIRDFIATRFGKVFIAGGAGACSQLIMYRFFHEIVETNNFFNLPFDFYIGGIDIYPRFIVSQLLSIEVGLVVSFFINNMWAFGDQVLKGFKFIRGLVKNHFVVIGGILIQLGIGQLLAAMFGISLLLSYIYQVVGIFVGLFWNFYFYKKFIWKIKQNDAAI